jgi:GMP synthase (glutamine-hydrolysing)
VLDPDDLLLGALDQPTRVHVTHMEAVLEPPPAARVIARAEGDPHHALHFGGSSWGVQFHPEFDAEIMACYIRLRADNLRTEGQDPDSLLAAVGPAPAGPQIMRRFADRVCLGTSKEKLA